MGQTITRFPTQPKSQPTLTVYCPPPKRVRYGQIWPENPPAWLLRRGLYPCVGIVHIGFYCTAGQFTQVTL